MWDQADAADGRSSREENSPGQSERVPLPSHVTTPGKPYKFALVHEIAHFSPLRLQLQPSPVPRPYLCCPVLIRSFIMAAKRKFDDETEAAAVVYPVCTPPVLYMEVASSTDTRQI